MEGSRRWARLFKWLVLTSGGVSLRSFEGETMVYIIHMV
jgi:hypothetical protein